MWTFARPLSSFHTTVIFRYPSWDAVVSDGLVTHCLAPHSLLRELRGVLVPEPPQRSARRTVVFASREGQRMRHLQDEAGLIADIEAGVWQTKQEPPLFSP